jgi:hypothetical protein
VAVSRAGASTLAELAALRLPAVLVPYPDAADNHQWHNAHAYEQTGAAVLLEQRTATPDALADRVLALLADAAGWQHCQTALGWWDKPGAAAEIADAICQSLGGGKQKAEGGKQKAESRKQKWGRWKPAVRTAPFCFLLSAFYFGLLCSSAFYFLLSTLVWRSAAPAHS